MSTTKRTRFVLFCLLAILQAGVVFVLGLASVSPDIHQALHAGEACPHHDCGSTHEKNGEDPAESTGTCPVISYGCGIELGTAPDLPADSNFYRKSVLICPEAAPDACFVITQRSRAPPTLLLA